MSDITSETLTKLPIGSKTTLKCSDAKKCESVATLAYRVPKRYPEYRDRRFKCSINYISSEITISVIPVSSKRK
jgi:hypothetical protein